MADNEERIAVVPFKGDFLRTQADWKHEDKYPACRLRNVYGMTRAEAVERMAKAMYVDNWKRRTPLVRVTNWEKGFADNMKKKYILAAEAALDALLGGKNVHSLE
ncbi:MAG: hypothetical protein J6J74_06060 [Elusimicrobiaceae bacterium]|nr:hypothetical protein [Elusimicrobiaceae bacterium]